MAHTNSWDETVPTNTTNATDIDDHIRKVRLDIRERFAIDHKAAASDAGESQYGVHKKVTFEDPIAEPTLAAGESCLYPETGDDPSELRYLDTRGVANLISFTGEIRMRLGTTVPDGWLALNGDTIGSAASGATKAHADYEELFIYLWDNLSNSEFAVSGGRGASGAADFAANKTGTMPDSRGRMPIGAGTGVGLTARTIGDTGGGETKDLDAYNHTHGPGSYVSATHRHTIENDLDGGGTKYILGPNDGPAGHDTTNPVHNHSGNTGYSGTNAVTGTSAVGSGLSAVDVVNPWIAYAFLIKY